MRPCWSRCAKATAPASRWSGPGSTICPTSFISITAFTLTKGVGCASCHGPVDKMPLMYQASSMRMEWCLNCHRAPEKFLRPRDQVFNMNYEQPSDDASGEAGGWHEVYTDQIALGNALEARSTTSARCKTLRVAIPVTAKGGCQVTSFKGSSRQFETGNCGTWEEWKKRAIKSEAVCPSKLELAEVQDKLARAESGPQYWRSLEELAQTEASSRCCTANFRARLGVAGGSLAPRLPEADERLDGAGRADRRA